MAIPQITKRRIAKLECKAGVGNKIDLTISLYSETRFEKLRERFGFKGYKPDVPVFFTHIETGVDGIERVKFSHPLVQTNLKNNQDISRGDNG